MQAEKAIEKYLCRQIIMRDGLCVKLTGVNGIPDRICLMPGAKFAFAELKAPGGRISPVQEARHRQLKKMGYEVAVLWNYDQVDDFLKEISNE